MYRTSSSFFIAETAGFLFVSFPFLTSLSNSASLLKSDDIRP